MATDVTYVRHRIPEYVAFRSADGMVGRWATKKAEEVAAQSRAFAPKPGQGKGYATGELAAGISAEKATVGRTGPEARVVSGTGHAIFVHEGTKPHIIRSKFGKKMSLFWAKTGKVVYTHVVRHPGTRANPYLSRALSAVFGGPGR